jgi:hypothetical protein
VLLPLFLGTPPLLVNWGATIYTRIALIPPPESRTLAHTILFLPTSHVQGMNSSVHEQAYPLFLFIYV